jgi:hypothetical protein
MKQHELNLQIILEINDLKLCLTKIKSLNERRWVKKAIKNREKILRILKCTAR